MIFRVFLGIGVMVIGFLIVWKAYVMEEWFGANAWAEDKLGPGGTNTFYKLAGVGLCFLGMFIATNLISDILSSIAKIFVR